MKVIVNEPEDERILLRIRELLEPLKDQITSISIDYSDVKIRLKNEQTKQSAASIAISCGH